MKIPPFCVNKNTLLKQMNFNNLLIKYKATARPHQSKPPLQTYKNEIAL